MNKFVDGVVKNHLDVGGNPKNEEGKHMLNLALTGGGESQTDKGYKSNTGRGRIIKVKDGKIDHLELSRLYHSGNW